MVTSRPAQIGEPRNVLRQSVYVVYVETGIGIGIGREEGRGPGRESERERELIKFSHLVDRNSAAVTAPVNIFDSGARMRFTD